MQIISQIVGTSCASMTVKHTEKADLWPLCIWRYLFCFWFKDIKDYRYSVFVVFSYDALICIGGIWFNVTTLLLTCFCRLMILKKNCFRIDIWCVTKKKSLYFNELNVWVDFFRARIRFSFSFLFWSNWSRLTQICFVSWSDWLVLLAKGWFILYLIMRNFFSAFRSSWQNWRFTHRR